jgi:hypothetical protein
MHVKKKQADLHTSRIWFPLRFVPCVLLLGQIARIECSSEQITNECTIASPNPLHVEYSNTVEIEFVAKDPKVYQVQHTGGQQRSNTQGATYSILLNSVSVGQVSCPATFKLRGLAPGTHMLALVPNKPSDAFIKNQRGSTSQQDHASVQTQNISFFVAAEDFWDGGRWAAPKHDLTTSRRRNHVHNDHDHSVEEREKADAQFEEHEPESAETGTSTQSHPRHVKHAQSGQNMAQNEDGRGNAKHEDSLASNLGRNKNTCTGKEDEGSQCNGEMMKKEAGPMFWVCLHAI